MRSNSVLMLSIILPALIVLSAPLCAQKHAQGAAHTAASKGQKRRTSIPLIARFLGVEVGKDSQERLEHQLGKGLRPSEGGHSAGNEYWKTLDPLGSITSDAIFHGDADKIMESLEWELCTPDSELPLVRRLPQHAGWLGKIVPGMTERQVTQLLKTTSLPPPIRSQSSWIWKQKGYAAHSDKEYDTWTATLEFKDGKLIQIEVNCE